MTSNEIRSSFLKYFEQTRPPHRRQLAARPARRPDAALHQRRDEPVQGRASSAARSASTRAPPRRRSACASAASTTISTTSGRRSGITRSSRCSGNFSFGDYFKTGRHPLCVGAADRRLEARARPTGCLPSSRASTASRATTRRTTSGGSSCPADRILRARDSTTTSGRWATRDRAAAARRSTTSAVPARIRRSKSGTTSSWSSSAVRTAR